MVVAFITTKKTGFTRFNYKRLSVFSIPLRYHAIRFRFNAMHFLKRFQIKINFHSFIHQLNIYLRTYILIFFFINGITAK